LDDPQKEIPLYAIILIGDIVLSLSLVVKKNLSLNQTNKHREEE
jgi:hypothetical protein